MIHDQRQIIINAPPEEVFSVIETMPNKFPTYGILETKPLLSLRILLVDGLRSAIKAFKMKRLNDTGLLDIGDLIGPFELIEAERPSKYLFTIRTLFFNCQTGYTLNSHETGTMLNFILIADNPKFREKLYWFFIKSFHILLAKKVLKAVRETVEMQS